MIVLQGPAHQVEERFAIGAHGVGALPLVAQDVEKEAVPIHQPPVDCRHVVGQGEAHSAGRGVEGNAGRGDLFLPHPVQKMPVEDGAGRMPNEMDLHRGNLFLELGQVTRQKREPRLLVRRGRCILLHLHPDRLHEQVLAGHLHRAVPGLLQPVLDIVPPPPRRVLRRGLEEFPHRIFEHAGNALAEAGLPGHEQGVDVVGQEIGGHDPDPLEGSLLVVEPSVGINGQLRRAPARQPGQRQAVGGLLHGADGIGHVKEPVDGATVIAEHDGMLIGPGFAQGFNRRIRVGEGL